MLQPAKYPNLIIPKNFKQNGVLLLGIMQLTPGGVSCIVSTWREAYKVVRFHTSQLILLLSSLAYGTTAHAQSTEPTQYCAQ